MKVVPQSHEVMTGLGHIECAAILARVANAARTCYRSEGANDASLVKQLVESGHEAMLEHAFISVRFITDRGISHELVRHRVASFAQESQRYCNYHKRKFDREITFVCPGGIEPGSEEYATWFEAMQHAEQAYMNLIDLGVPPETARSVLPNSTRTEIVVTANLREWRHIMKLRCVGVTGAPHPDMVRLMKPLLLEFKEALPEVFGDV